MKFLFGTCLVICVGFAVSIVQTQLDRDKKNVNVIRTVCQKYLLPTDHIITENLPESEAFPWMAALGYGNEKTNDLEFKCGGTLISEVFILTAAHCTFPHSPVVVRLGMTNLKDTSATSYHIKEIIRHPNFSDLFENDIALIRLTRPVEFSRYIRPACLETNLSDLAPNEQLIVTGWGIASTSTFLSSDELGKATATTVPLSECNKTYVNYSHEVDSPDFLKGITKSQYCAADLNGRTGPCRGDSGVPLQIFRHEHTAHVVGIVSTGVGCASGLLPVIYTRVAYYSDWIVANVWPETTGPKEKNTRNLIAACEKYSADPTVFLINNGTKVAPRDFPWMAALVYSDSHAFDIKVKCGGIIISELFILTAAHCDRPLLARLGAVNLYDTMAENYDIKEFIPHPEFSRETGKNDIALIKVDKEILFSPLVRPACIETDVSDIQPEILLNVTGWGSTSPERSRTSNDLMKAEVMTVPLTECNVIYLEYNKKAQIKFYQYGISDSQYCARDPVGRSGSCNGDSGGPLQIFRNNRTAHVVGIVSLGTACGTLPTVHTRVAHYAEWIASHFCFDCSD